MLEAYCRPGSTDRDWHETVIPHESELVLATDDGKRIELRDRLSDGVVVNHDAMSVISFVVLCAPTFANKGPTNCLLVGSTDGCCSVSDLSSLDACITGVEDSRLLHKFPV